MILDIRAYAHALTYIYIHTFIFITYVHYINFMIYYAPLDNFVDLTIYERWKNFTTSFTKYISISDGVQIALMIMISVTGWLGMFILSFMPWSEDGVGPTFV